MRHLWPAGLILILIASLPGCTAHHAVPIRDQGSPHCSRMHVDCVGQTSAKTTADTENSPRPEPFGTLYSVSKQILNTRSEDFVHHAGEGKFESYLIQNIPFEPVEDLRRKIETHNELSLKHRGEAHITIITPPEFERLSSHLSIEAINALAFETVQDMTYELVCVGRGKATTTNTSMSTFFIVVRSDDITALREQIATAYGRAGGPAPAFTTAYNPHITIGFTHRDLYDSDGVNKNVDSCVAGIAANDAAD